MENTTETYPSELALTEKELESLRNYFMTAGFITYGISGLHDVINKIIRHADANELARRTDSSA